MKTRTLLLTVLLLGAASADDLFMADGRNPSLTRNLIVGGQTYNTVQIVRWNDSSLELMTKQGPLTVSRSQVPSLWLSAINRREAEAAATPPAEGDTTAKQDELAAQILAMRSKADERCLITKLKVVKSTGEPMTVMLVGFRKGRRELLISDGTKVAWVPHTYFSEISQDYLRNLHIPTAEEESRKAQEEEDAATAKPGKATEKPGKSWKTEIADRAAQSWPDDARMQVSVIKRETEAYRQLLAWDESPPYGLSPSQFEKLSDAAIKAWPGDYSMQIYHIKSEVDALEKLKTLRE